MATAKKAPAKKAGVKSAGAKKTAAKKTSAAAKKSSPAAKKTPRARPDATALLIKDHKDVRTLFKRYEKMMKAEAEGSERQQIAEQICQMLTVHAQIEEEIFYPALRESQVDEDLMDEAEVEHGSAKDMIAQIRGMSPEEDLYDAKVTVLGEYVTHHVEEEEGDMFRKAKRAKVDLVALGEQLQTRKQELMSGSNASSGMAASSATTTA